MTTSRKRKLAGLLGAAIVTAALSAHAHAALIDFDQLTDGGTVSYAGGVAPLIGTDIRFDRVIGVGTPANAGVVLYCIGASGCDLDFTTGANTDSVGPVLEWAGGGSFTVTGTLNTLANGTGTTVATGTLLTGTWSSPVVGHLVSGGINVSGGGPDTKTESLYTYYGYTVPNFLFSNTEITANWNGSSGSVTEADLTNTPVPEPATLMLLGSGLVGLGWFGRKRLKHDDHRA